MRTLLIMLLAFRASVALAGSIDASDCEDRADHLRREARDLADAAQALSSVSSDDPDQHRTAQDDVRSHLEDVRYRFRQTSSACGAPPAATYPIAIATIRGYLVMTHGDTPPTRLRVKEIDAELVALAHVHVSAQPEDYRMTYAMAEVVFSNRH